MLHASSRHVAPGVFITQKKQAPTCQERVVCGSQPGTEGEREEEKGDGFDNSRLRLTSRVILVDWWTA